MALFNYAAREITAKIVYYGPALCGKTTNLRIIYNKVDTQKRGQLVSLETEGDRTLFFDLLPIEIGTIKGFRIKFQLYTVPGQVFYNATRRLVLNNTDAVVFVADSQKSRLEANIESLINLRENLQDQNVDLDLLPWMIQVNKRDLENIETVENILESLGNPKVPHTKAIAAEGVGVFETLKIISKLLVRDLEKQLESEDEEEEVDLMKRMSAVSQEEEEEVNLDHEDVNEIEEQIKRDLHGGGVKEISEDKIFSDNKVSEKKEDQVINKFTNLRSNDTTEGVTPIWKTHDYTSIEDTNEVKVESPYADFNKKISEQKTEPPHSDKIVLESYYPSDTQAQKQEKAESEAISDTKALALTDYEIPKELIEIIPYDTVVRFMVIPLEKKGKKLKVATVHKDDMFILDDLSFITGCEIIPVLGNYQSIKKAIDKYYGALVQKDVEMEVSPSSYSGEYSSLKKAEEAELAKAVDIDSYIAEGPGDLEEYVQVADDNKDIYTYVGVQDEQPIIKLVNSILLKAIKRKASDIHFEVYEKTFRVRFRIDGELETIEINGKKELPYNIKNAVVSRLKIMSKCDISERRVPQDGRITLVVGGEKGKMDYRVSFLPTLFGEKVVLRLLDMSNLTLDLDKLGFEPKALEDFKRAIESPYGMVLVTGPTGSGKTTTLYSALSLLNDETTNITTCEDPVEFNFFGINQVNVNEAAGLTFASALRSFLRQDPDIIMVGEIRDLETAEISIKAALTGHLVLSTLHTNDAPSTVSRLMNMGVQPFLLASALKLVVAQRLARRICSKCKVEVEMTERDRKFFEEHGYTEDKIKEIKLYKGMGCEACDGKGYKGRVALYEVMPVSEDDIGAVIMNNGTTDDIRNKAKSLGMLTLREAGIEKIKQGVTTIEEVLKNTLKA